MRQRVKERRRSPRANLPAEVRYHQASKAGPARLASATDLSESGMGLSPPELLPPRALLKLKVPLVGGGPLRLHGKVAWSSRREGALNRRYRAGVRLLKVGKVTRKRLKSWVDGTDAGQVIF